MTENPRLITNWIMLRLDEMEGDVTPLDPHNNYQNVLAEYILADIQSKRRLIERHQPHEYRRNVFVCTVCIRDIKRRPLNGNDDCTHENAPWPCNEIREATSPFTYQHDHPEWRPDSVKTGDLG